MLIGSRGTELSSLGQGRNPRAPASLPSTIISSAATHCLVGTLLLADFYRLFIFHVENSANLPYIRHHVRRRPAEAREGLHKGRRQAHPGSRGSCKGAIYIDVADRWQANPLCRLMSRVRSTSCWCWRSKHDRYERVPILHHRHHTH